MQIDLKASQMVQLLKVSQVADALQISKSSAYRLCKNGDLPAVRFNGSVRVRISDLEHFIVNNLRGGDYERSLR